MKNENDLCKLTYWDLFTYDDVLIFFCDEINPKSAFARPAFDAFLEDCYKNYFVIAFVSEFWAFEFYRQDWKL